MKKKKLTIHRETLRRLRSRELEEAEGGTGPTFFCSVLVGCSGATSCAAPNYCDHLCPGDA